MTNKNKLSAFMLIGGIGAGIVGGIAPAMAQSVCTPPIAPAPVDGASVTKEQMVAAIADAKAFIAQSDVYQTCLGDELKVQKDAAAKDKKPFDKSIQDTAMAKADDNQKMKEKVGTEINISIGAYKKAHP